MFWYSEFCFSALLRPGRFDVQIPVSPPNYKGRKEILEHYLSKVTVAPDLNIDPLARATMGCTGADLANIVNQAAIKACLDNATEVTEVHLEFAKDKILMGRFIVSISCGLLVLYLAELDNNC